MNPAEALRSHRVRDTSAGGQTPAATYLLDVNVLIALLDPMHSHHIRAHAWFDRDARTAWATCPLSQNGVLRIMGHARYPEGSGSPAQVVAILEELCALPGHRFWPNDLSLLDNGLIDRGRLQTHLQITDTYLLALAVKQGGKLATFDKRLVADAVRGGKSALHLIE